MSGDCSLINNNLYVKPVETCTFAALYKFNNSRDSNLINNSSIYTDDFKNVHTDINKNFRNKTTNEYIYEYTSNGNKDLCFPLKENDKNSPYAVNCVILTGNPLYTYDKTKKTCTIIPELAFEPAVFKYNENKDYIYYDNTVDPEGKYSYNKKDKSGYCENKWYDWITIPNYHFGNGYLKESGSFSKEDVKICYAPCEKNKIPYIDINNEYKCVNKKIAENGLYEKKMDYSPISLINLIGNSQQDLTKLYILMTLYEYKNIDNDNYEIITDRTILNSNCKINIFTGKINECNDNIYNNYNEPRTTYKELSDVIMKNIINIDTFDIIKKYENYPNLITYKNPYFEEKDNQNQQLTLLGLTNYNMIKDAILIHTFIIACNIYKFIEIDIFNNISYDKDKNNKFYIYNDYDLNNKLDKLLENNDIYKNKDDKTKLNIKKRLANILYKAINVCYNNQTDFSKNILNLTKIAFDRYKVSNNKDLVNKNIGFKNAILNNNKFEIKTDNTKYNNEITDINNYINYLNTGINITLNIIDSNIDTLLNDRLFKTITNNSEYNINDDSIRDLIKKTIKNYPLYFRTELIEETICGDNYIYDLKTQNCVACATYCDSTNNKCENPRCKLYCKIQCTEPPITGDNRIVGKTACGDIKSQKTKEEAEKINETANKYSETPLGENSFDFFSLFNNSIKSVMSIVFFLIIIYIFYIIYQVFGESLLLLFNFISYWLLFIFKTIIATFKAIYTGNYNAISRYVAFDLAEYEKDININRYERVTTKLFTKPS